MISHTKNSKGKNSKGQFLVETVIVIERPLWSGQDVLREKLDNAKSKSLSVVSTF